MQISFSSRLYRRSSPAGGLRTPVVTCPASTSPSAVDQPSPVVRSSTAAATSADAMRTQVQIERSEQAMEKTWRLAHAFLRLALSGL
jgi:hypothetical protein